MDSPIKTTFILSPSILRPNGAGAWRNPMFRAQQQKTEDNSSFEAPSDSALSTPSPGPVHRKASIGQSPLRSVRRALDGPAEPRSIYQNDLFDDVLSPADQGCRSFRPLATNARQDIDGELLSLCWSLS